MPSKKSLKPSNLTKQLPKTKFFFLNNYIRIEGA